MLLTLTTVVGAALVVQATVDGHNREVLALGSRDILVLKGSEISIAGIFLEIGCESRRVARGGGRVLDIVQRLQAGRGDGRSARCCLRIGDGDNLSLLRDFLVVSELENRRALCLQLSESGCGLDKINEVGEPVRNAVGERSEFGLATCLVLVPCEVGIQQLIGLLYRRADADPIVVNERFDALLAEPFRDGIGSFLRRRSERPKLLARHVLSIIRVAWRRHFKDSLLEGICILLTKSDLQRDQLRGQSSADFAPSLRYGRELIEHARRCGRHEKGQLQDHVGMTRTKKRKEKRTAH